jgi:hypothetical protein
MNSIRVLILLTLGLFGALEAYGHECYVVSGLGKDWNGALKRDEQLLSGKKIINGVTCVSFDSWSNLYKYYLEQSKNQKIKKTDEVLILQGAHGNSKGEISTDYGDNASDVLEIVNKIASKNKTGLILKTCYSGNIMKKKLVSDDQNPKNASLSNLCLIVSSPFGRPSGTDILTTVSEALQGSTMEGLFLNSDLSKTEGKLLDGTVTNNFSSGLISSAAWSESGVVDYWLKPTDIKACGVLEQMANIATKYCYDDSFAISSFNQKWLDYERYQMLSFIDYLDCGGKGDNSYSKTELLSNINTKDGSEKDEKCASSWKAFLSTYKPGRSEDFFSYRDCVESISGFFLSDAPCLEWVTIVSTFNRTPTIYSDFRKFEKYRQIIKQDLNIDILKTKLKRKVIEQLYSSKNIDLGCVGKKELVDNALFAEEACPIASETVSGWGKDYKGFDAKIVTRGFVTGSLKKEKYINALDIKRRKACREFVIWPSDGQETKK